MQIRTTPTGGEGMITVFVKFDRRDQCLYFAESPVENPGSELSPMHEVLMHIGIPAAYVGMDGYVGYYRFDPDLGHSVPDCVQPLSNSYNEFVRKMHELEPDVEYTFTIDFSQFNLFGKTSDKDAKNDKNATVSTLRGAKQWNL